MKKRPAWPYPRVLAHRGGGVLAPENTLGAIRTDIAHGFRAVEFDAMLPADDTPILMHDSTLARTAGRTGAVTDFRAADLAQFDVGLRSCGQVPAIEMCDISTAPGSPDGNCNIVDALRVAQCDVGLGSCDFACEQFTCPLP